MKPGTVILGIDPGTNILGFGIISAGVHGPEYVDMGVLDIRKETDPYGKLAIIHDNVSEIIKTYHPDILAIESPFYGKNAQVIFKLGRAQGAAIVAASRAGLPVYEYAPRKAKEAITGNGAASKEQVSLIIQRTLKVELDDKYLDATDALALALCHYYQSSSPLASLKGSGSWESFLKEHPDRIK
ncbi:MAG: crossover junction endodeoxyribonuclease RuvC [Bacteroidales bacterium]|nr:crossover junction endodeoxyribonuclease RuvC [Bacteroidales bacterium]